MNRKDIIITGTILIVLAYLIFHVASVVNVFTYALAVLTPILVGAILAFVINIPLNFFEKRVFAFMDKKPFLKKIKRPVSLIVVLIIILSIFALIFIMLVPQLVNIVSITIEKLPSALRGISYELSKYGISVSDYISKYFNFENTNKAQIEQTFNLASNILLHGISSSSNIIGSVFSNVMASFFVAMIVVYILLSKERLQRQFYKLLYCSMSQKRADNTKVLIKRANKIFANFIVGQCVEALILGTLIFISMSIFKMPYAIFISVLVAIFALIPIIGAWIAVISGAILILTVNFQMALYFILMFVVVQTIEGSAIYPRVVGNAIGLPPLWILVAVVIGQSFFGIFGTLFLIPLTSLIYVLLDEHTDRIIKKKGISPDSLK